MYCSIETGKFREKFEVHNDTNGKVNLDCTVCTSSNYTHISHFWGGVCIWWQSHLVVVYVCAYVLDMNIYMYICVCVFVYACVCVCGFFPCVWYRDWETDRKSTRLNSSH